MNCLEEISKRRKKAHKKLRKSKVFEAFLQMQEAAFAEGALPVKVKELIAVGASIVMDCEPCVQWHIEHATKAGASKQEVLEAVEVGIEMGHGPTIGIARYALEVMEGVHEKK